MGPSGSMQSRPTPVRRAGLHAPEPREDFREDRAAAIALVTTGVLSSGVLLTVLTRGGGGWVPIGADPDPPSVRFDRLHQGVGREPAWVPLRC